MKKMKKMIALVTLAMFLFAFAAPVSAATFSDVTGAAADEIYRLNSLGIINGYTDGTFKPDANITRAEFAVIALSAAGLKSSSDALKGNQSVFPDVATGDWYNGWVNLAYSQGFMKGYPDGTFKPNNNITYAECITVLVRILGYNENLPGTWPVEYLVKAAEIGITDDVTYQANVLATRSNIAIMGSQALDCDLVKWNKETDTFDDKYTPAQTLAENKFDLERYDEDNIYISQWGKDADGKFTITINDTDGNDAVDALTDFNLPATLTVADTAVVNGAANIPDAKFQQIEFDYNTDDEEVTYINVTSTKVSAIADDVDITGTDVELNDTKTYKAATNVVDAVAAGQAYYTLYVDKDGEYYISYETNTNVGTAAALGLVDEYNASTEKVSFKNGVGTIELKDKDVLVIKDGKIAAAADIKENDLVFDYTTYTNLDHYLKVVTVNKAGKVEAAYNTAPLAIKIAGVKYDVDAANRVSTDGGDVFSNVAAVAGLDDLYNQDVKFALDAKGDVFAIISDKESADNTQYGILTEVLDETLAGKVTKVKIFKADGTEASFDVDSANYEIEWKGDVVAFTPDLVLPDTATDADYAISYKLNADGKISDMDLLGATGAMNDSTVDTAIESSKKVEVDGAWYYMDSNTKILSANGTDDAETLAIGTFAKDVENADVANGGVAGDVAEPCWAKVDGNKVEYIFLAATNYGATSEDYAMILDSYNKDGDLWIDVDVRGTETSYEAVSGTAGVVTDTLYSYTLNGGKVDLNTKQTGFTYSEIYDVDSTLKSLKVSSTKWLEVDADTYIYDLTGTDPAWKTFSDVGTGDYVLYKEDVVDTDRAGVIDVLFIVDEGTAAY